MISNFYFSLLFCLSSLLNSSISFNLLPATFQLLKRLLMRAGSCAVPNVLWIWKVSKTAKNTPFLPLPSKEKNQREPQQYSISDFMGLSCFTQISTPPGSCNKHPGKAKRIWDNDRPNQGHYGPQRPPSFPLSLAPPSNRVLISLIVKKHCLILNICPWTKGWPAAALSKWDGLPCFVPPTV